MLSVSTPHGASSGTSHKYVESSLDIPLPKSVTST